MKVVMVVDDTVRLIEELTELALGRGQLVDADRSSRTHHELTREVDNVRANAEVDALPDPVGSLRFLKQSVLKLGSFNWVRQRSVNQSLARAVELLRDQLADLQRQTEVSTRSAASTLATLETSLAAMETALQAAVETSRADAATDREQARQSRDELERLVETHGDGQTALRTRIERLESELAFERRRSRAVRDQLAELRPAATPGAESVASATTPTPTPTPAPALAPSEVSAPHAWDDLVSELYARFEASFRPGDEELHTRFAEYLDDLSPLRGGSAPVLDIGTGRGDFLAVLAEAGIPAAGVDLDADAVAEARERGLRVERADALEFLRAAEPMSVGAVTAFHIVEHLPPGLTVAILDAALQALVPGGLVILETPNPTNLRIGAAAFYNDPTHQRPITPTYLEWMVRDRGFGDVVTRFLHPLAPKIDPTLLEACAPDVVSLVDDVDWALRGPQDFAVVGRRPPAR